MAEPSRAGFLTDVDHLQDNLFDLCRQIVLGTWHTLESRVSAADTPPPPDTWGRWNLGNVICIRGAVGGVHHNYV